MKNFFIIDEYQDFQLKNFLELAYREVRIKYWKENFIVTKEQSHFYYSFLRKKKMIIRSFFRKCFLSTPNNLAKNLILVEKRLDYNQEKIKFINVIQR